MRFWQSQVHQFVINKSNVVIWGEQFVTFLMLIAKLWRFWWSCLSCRVAQRSITRWFNGRGAAVLVGRGVTEEFCVKIRNLFNYFSRLVPRTIEFVHHVTLFPGRFKMARLKIDRTMLDLSVKIRDCWVLVGPYHCAHRLPPPLLGYLKGMWAIWQAI